jgi:GNAT superfamily N-acetyltransferase
MPDKKELVFEIREVAEDDLMWVAVCERFGHCVEWHKEPEDVGEYRFLLAVDPKGDALGGAVIDCGYETWGPMTGRRIGMLEDLRVEEPYRRQGVGSALVMAALQRAWETGAPHVWWTVSFGNEEAIAFCDSLGFALIPQRDTDPETGSVEEYYLVVAQNPERVVGVTEEEEGKETTNGNNGER